MPHIIAIDGIIGFDVTVEGIRQEIKDANGEDISLEVSSPGGSVFEGIAIFNLIKNIEQNVTAHIIGLAGSMASIIPLAANRVTAEKTTVFFIHNALTFAFGNQNDLRKTANILEGLSNLLGKVLAEKSGKSQSEIAALMDEETFFFGEEMLEAGFVDEVIQGQSTDSEEEALAFAQLQIQECNAKLKQAEPEDYNKIAALLVTKDTQANKNKNIQAPEPDKKTRTQRTASEVTNTNPQTKEIMDLDKLLAENPEANATYNERIKTAKKEGSEVVEARITQMSKYIGNDHYSNVALKGLTGEISIDSVMAVITMKDQELEAIASAEAAAETDEKGDTAAEETTASIDGIANSEQDMDAIVAKTNQSIEG